MFQKNLKKKKITQNRQLLRSMGTPKIQFKNLKKRSHDSISPSRSSFTPKHPFSSQEKQFLVQIQKKLYKKKCIFTKKLLNIEVCGRPLKFSLKICKISHDFISSSYCSFTPKHPFQSQENNFLCRYKM